MTTKEQNRKLLREYLRARAQFPWIARYAAGAARTALNDLGGIAGSWRTDYSECTYYYTVHNVGDLSTVEKVRQYYELENTF